MPAITLLPVIAGDEIGPNVSCVADAATPRLVSPLLVEMAVFLELRPTPVLALLSFRAEAMADLRLVFTPLAGVLVVLDAVVFDVLVALGVVAVLGVAVVVVGVVVVVVVLGFESGFFLFRPLVSTFFIVSTGGCENFDESTTFSIE